VTCVLFLERDSSSAMRPERKGRTNAMDGLTGLAAVIMIFGMPTAILGMYTFYRVRKLRTEERLAAMQRGVSVPMEPDLTEAAHSRRAGILLIAGAVGYMLAFSIIARVEPDALVAGAFGAIPFTLGLGYLLDSTLIRRDARTS
jgi:hypothetical protein